MKENQIEYYERILNIPLIFQIPIISSIYGIYKLLKINKMCKEKVEKN